MIQADTPTLLLGIFSILQNPRIFTVDK